MDINILTPLGISTTVGILMQFLKPIYKKYIYNEITSKFLVIFTVFFMSELFSFLIFWGEMIENDTVQIAIIRGSKSALIAIGGFEGLKQLFTWVASKISIGDVVNADKKDSVERNARRSHGVEK